MSDSREADIANETIDKVATFGALKHAINVRPLGFGSPRNSKPSPRVLMERLSQFDYLWIIANHRQRHTGRFAIGLSMSSMASRFVKVTAQALIDCLCNEEGRDLLKSTFGRKKLGLVGSVRFLPELNPKDLIRRALYSMLCEDAYLHSAERIVVLWPYEFSPKERYQKIRFGRHAYDVELIQRERNPRSLSLVSFALNVQPSRRTRQDFRDFCISLLACYGWEVRSESHEYIIFQNDREGIRVWPTESLDEIQSITSLNAEFQRYTDLILTNRTLTRSIREKAEIFKWSVIHYSELSIWMNESNRLRRHDIA
jgi:hypothetical protein